MSMSEFFQGRSNRVGRKFEQRSKYGLTGYGPLVAERVWVGDKLVEVDLEFENAYVFAKGGENDRPGLRRTDNTKKCIADVSMLKSLIDGGKIEDKAIVVTTTAIPTNAMGAAYKQYQFLSGLVDAIVVFDDWKADGDHSNEPQ